MYNFKIIDKDGMCMRRYYLDNIRWITVCIVALYHVIFMYNGIVSAGTVGAFHQNQWQDGIMYLLYPWFMVLLFIVAGMCSRYYLEKHKIKEFIASRSLKLLVPSTLGLFVFFWIQGYISMAISNAFESIPENVPAVVNYFIMALSGQGVLWFAQLLWLLSLILALIAKIEKGKLYKLTEKFNTPLLILLVLPVFLSGQVLNTPVVVVYRFGIYGFTYLLGYFVFAHDEVIDRLSRFSIPLIITSVILGGVYLYLHYGDNYADMPVVGCPSAVAFCWSTCLAILGSFRKWGNKTNSFLKYMSSRSFGIYVFHYITLSGAALLLTKTVSMQPFVYYIIGIVTSIGGGLLLFEIISRIPVLSWFTLGIRKGKKKCSRKT